MRAAVGATRLAAAAGVLASVLTLAAAPPSPQVPPAWLEDAPAPRVETMHLEAVALEPVWRDDGWLSLRVRITPKPNMRIYAHDVTGYVPLSLSVPVRSDITKAAPIFPPSTTYTFPPTGERSRVFVAPLVVEVRLRPDGPWRHPGDLTGELRYQACDDRLCYKPATVKVRWRVDRGRQAP